jgi:hypothetical protein
MKTQLAISRRKSCQLGSKALLLCLLALIRLPSTYALQDRGNEELSNRQLQLPSDVDSKPGETFVSDEQLGSTRMKTSKMLPKMKGGKAGDSPLSAQEWTLKKHKKCGKKKRKKKKKAKSTTSSPSQSYEPTLSPSISSEPSGSMAPSFSSSKKTKKGKGEVCVEGTDEGPEEGPGPGGGPDGPGGGPGEIPVPTLSPAPSVTFIPTMTWMPTSTPYPSFTFFPTESGINGNSPASGGDGIPGEVCENILNALGPPEETEAVSFDVGIAIGFDLELTSSGVVRDDLVGISPALALWSAGCETLATSEYLSRRLTELSRYLQEQEPITNVEYVEFEEWAISGMSIKG